MANATPPSEHPALKGMRSVLAGGLVNFLLVIVKLTAGILGNSYALVADAIESATDIVSSFILWFGLKVASKAPDSNHPYGHGKAEPMAGAIVALSLAAAAVLIVVEAVHNILTPHRLPAAFTLWILGGIIFLKEGLFRYVAKVGKEIGSQAVKADAWHHRSDAISSAAAFIGILIARIGGNGYETADDYAAIVAAGVILVNAYRILRPALAEIMDTAPPSTIVNEVKKVAAGVPGVAGLDKCYVRKMGFEYFVDLHVEVDGRLSVHEGHEIAHRVKEAILNADSRIRDVLIHIEPFHPAA
jgi:cation diffusion facilitator family transporter